MVFWFLGFGPKSPIWRLLGLLAASVLASHFRRMLISKNHINPQLILPKMRFLAAHFGLKLAQNRVCSSKQKTSLACVKLTFCVFIDHKIDWNLMHRKGGYLGLPGLDPAPSGPQIDPKSIENRPRLDPTSTLETVIILAACRSSYCMSFILFHVVHLIGRLSQRSSTRI